MPEWDKCKPGSSALDAALNRSLLAEVTHRLGEHSVAVLWDLEKFFDTISTSDLVEAAMELDFPLYRSILPCSSISPLADFSAKALSLQPSYQRNLSSRVASSPFHVCVFICVAVSVQLCRLTLLSIMVPMWMMLDSLPLVA